MGGGALRGLVVRGECCGVLLKGVAALCWGDGLGIRGWVGGVVIMLVAALCWGIRGRCGPHSSAGTHVRMATIELHRLADGKLGCLLGVKSTKSEPS